MWNCSREISRLHTCFYSGISTIKNFERLEEAGLLDGKIIIKKSDYCTSHIVPINNLVMKMYSPIEKKNREGWNEIEKEDAFL